MPWYNKDTAEQYHTVRDMKISVQLPSEKTDSHLHWARIARHMAAAQLATTLAPMAKDLALARGLFLQYHDPATWTDRASHP